MLSSAFFTSLFVRPRNLRQALRVSLVNPLDPTSTGKYFISQPASWPSLMRSSYLHFFLWLAWAIFSSAGTVSSMTTANFSLGEYIVMPGLLDVVTISGGNMAGILSSSHTTFCFGSCHPTRLCFCTLCPSQSWRLYQCGSLCHPQSLCFLLEGQLVWCVALSLHTLMVLPSLS